MFQIKYSIVLVICFYANYTFADIECGDWQTYKNEKCIKISYLLQSYDKAMQTCSQYNATLITISSSEEQQFVENYLFAKLKIIENVWTGLKYVDSKYKWDNNMTANYTNWSEGSPKNQSDLCVQISSDVSIGKWSDISCAKWNFALCQYVPSITRQQLLTGLLNAGKGLENKNAKQKATIQSLENTNSEVENIINLLSHTFSDTNITYDYASLQQILSIISARDHLNLTLNELILTLTSLESRTKLVENTVQQLRSKLENKELEDLLNGRFVKTFTENNVRKAFVRTVNFTNQRYSRSEALELCHKLNATLVDIESQEKQKIVESYLHQIPSNALWLGAYNSSGEYKWLNSGNKLQYTNWYPGYPASRPNGDYLYLVNDYGVNEGKWVNTGADDKNAVFCEVVIN